MKEMASNHSILVSHSLLLNYFSNEQSAKQTKANQRQQGHPAPQ
jgi:hypothetical protein